MKTFNKIVKTKDQLLRSYFIVIMITYIGYLITDYLNHAIIENAIIIGSIVLSYALIIFFKGYRLKSVQYFAMLFSIATIYYITLNRQSSYANIFYINIALAIVFIFDIKEDLYKIASLFILMTIAVCLNLFTTWLQSGRDFTEQQAKLGFTILFITFIIYFVVNIFYIIKKRHIVSPQLESKTDTTILLDINHKDIVSIKEMNKLKSELYEDYKGFLNHFQLVFPVFYQKMKNMNCFTVSELEILALIKLNFVTSEIAQVTNLTVKSIESKRYRIRKKIGISTSQDLYSWVDNV